MEMKDTRSGFGAGLTELGKTNSKVVALCADLTGSLKMNEFQNNHPERFFQVGIAEANMMGIAAGMTIGGKIPFTGTFANFSTSRVYDQIRQSIAYSNKNVKICASHAGVTLGEDGATHQILEDIGMMKMLPHMTVINPCDFNQTKAATLAIAEHMGPVYLRFGRPKVPNFTDENQKFEIGKAVNLKDGNDFLDLTSTKTSLSGESIEINAGLGNDIVWSSDGNEIIDLGDGDDQITFNGGSDTLVSGLGSDVISISTNTGTLTISDLDISKDKFKFYVASNKVSATGNKITVNNSLGDYVITLSNNPDLSDIGSFSTFV